MYTYTHTYVCTCIKLRLNSSVEKNKMRLVPYTLASRRINKSQLRELMQRVILAPKSGASCRMRGVKAFLSCIVAETITRTIPSRL